MNDNRQKQVFENENIWSDMEGKQGEIERSQYTISLIPKAVKSVLDVGCGSGIITNRVLAERVVGLDFSRTALKKLVYMGVEGNLLSLPFSDNSFDLIICSEVIEHISYFDYFQVLAELSRVSSQYLLISVPCEENLQRSQVICPGCGCRFQPYYHMRSFHEKSMKNLFVEHGFSLKFLSTMGKKRDYLGLSYLLNLFGKTTFPKTTVCPQCGFYRKAMHGEAKASSGSTHVKPQAEGMKGIGRKLWPKGKTRPRWWIALYEKV